MAYASLKAFVFRIRGVVLSPWFRVTNIEKYTGETRSDIWLADYNMACQTSGCNDYIVIHSLPIFLANMAWAWLISLSRDIIQNWSNLETLFVNNF